MNILESIKENKTLLYILVIYLISILYVLIIDIPQTCKEDVKNIKIHGDYCISSYSQACTYYTCKEDGTISINNTIMIIIFSPLIVLIKLIFALIIVLINFLVNTSLKWW